MATRAKSEIRDSTIRELLAAVKKQDYGSYLRKIRLDRVRAFTGEVVEFDFPVTALIGPNGGGKSTVLGAAAIAYKSIRPALFFPKSSIGDDTMSNWSIGYDLIEKTKNPTQIIQRSSRFKNSKWARDDLIERPVLYFGIQRTVPAGERKEFKKFATVNYKFTGVRSALSKQVQDQVAKILGKDVSKFEQADISQTQKFYIGGDDTISYSEFHFGAGESSIIRMVGLIESAPTNALVLIEEIENGLHPVAVRRMVEYLIDAAERRSIQTIFTTHSEDALGPIPPEAIWASIDGKAQQGKISIESLRAITGRIDETTAVFTEDLFAKEWTEGIIRSIIPEHIDEIGVYSLNGDGRAHATHMSHMQNPSMRGKLNSVCVLDGDSSIPEDLTASVIKLPGKMPESEVFNYVHGNIATLSMKLAVALHLPASQEEHVKNVVNEVAKTNRDPHVLFSQVGDKAGLVPVSIVSSAFISQWLDGNKGNADRIATFIKRQVLAGRK